MAFRLRLLAATAAVCLAAPAASADLIIEEIVDATLTGGQPKWVEIKNLGSDCVYLGDYELCNYNNGNTSPAGCTSLSTVFLAPGNSFNFAYEFSNNTGCSSTVTCFEFTYGKPADQHGGPFINGDDVVALRLISSSSIVDVYGLIGEDGTGTAWEYMDGYSTRKGTVTAPTSIFDVTEWDVAGANSLDGLTAAQIAALTSPGNYADCPPATYCTAGTSGSGCNAMMSASGTASATATSGFSLMASGVEGSKNGLFFFSVTGRTLTPWGNGGSFMCVASPRYRTPVQQGVGTQGACDGAFSLDLNAMWCATCPLPNKNFGAGTIIDAQLWYRDPFTTAMSPGKTSLSNAIEFGVGP